jgi:tetratricopeptide (TPR) repeat protein
MAINKNKVMEAAQKFVEKGQTDKAIKEYQKVVQEDPKDVRVWLKIGDLHAKKGAKQEATETYMKVAQFYGEQGFYLKAVAVYKQILKIDARLIDVNLKLADLYRQLGLLSDAVQQYELVAAFYHREGKTREALATIKELVDLDPENVATRIKLAELYSKEGLAKEAITEFGKAADFLRSHQRMDDFIKVAERLVWHQPDNHAINRELATLYLKRNDPRRALQKLQACFKADPRDVETLALLASAFQALDQRPKTVSVWKELARIYQENGQPGQATETYRKILTLAPDDADALAAIGGAAKRAATAPVAAPREPAPLVPAMAPAMAPSRPAPAAMAPVSTTPPAGAAAWPRISTPIASEPAPPLARRTSAVHAVPRIAEPVEPVDFPPPVRSSVAPMDPRRATGPVNAISRPFEPLVSDGARFDLDDEPSVRVSTRDATARRNVDIEVDLEMDDSPPSEEVLLEPGADPAEVHADEIAKILTETDVYIKYGLQQKAIEHLKRVFELDSRNVEARERLKDIFIGVGRTTEAVAELAKLIELCGAQNRGQAEAYLRELGALDPDDPRVGSLAARFHLSVEMPPQAPDRGMDASEAVEVATSEPIAEGEVGIDFDEISVEMTTPVPVDPEGSAPIALALAEAQESPYEVELSSDEAAAAPTYGAEPESSEFSLDGDEVLAPEVDPAFAMDHEDGFQAPEDYGQGAADEAGGEGPADDFDLEVPGAELPGRYVVPRRRMAAGPEEQTFDGAMPDDDSLAVGATAGPSSEIDEFSLDPSDEALAESLGDAASQDPESAPAQGRSGAEGAGTDLEDDLDEADFFIGQSLFGEARGVLSDLLERHPDHPLVLAKLQDLDAADPEGAQAASAPHLAKEEAEFDAALEPHVEVSAPPALSAAPPPNALPPQATVVANLLDDEDAETHYNLGLAYKDMGLFDKAIHEFSLVLHNPGRSVQCHLMIGLCHTGLGQFGEAVAEFKKGLYVDGIQDEESLHLYYEIGAAYEAQDDVREALYYFEKVSKREARYRDVQNRLAVLRQASAAGKGPAKNGNGHSAVDDEADAALDALLGPGSDVTAT